MEIIGIECVNVDVYFNVEDVVGLVVVYDQRGSTDEGKGMEMDMFCCALGELGAVERGETGTDASAQGTMCGQKGLEGGGSSRWSGRGNEKRQ